MDQGVIEIKNTNIPEKNHKKKSNSSRKNENYKLTSSEIKSIFSKETGDLLKSIHDSNIKMKLESNSILEIKYTGSDKEIEKNRNKFSKSITNRSSYDRQEINSKEIDSNNLLKSQNNLKLGANVVPNLYLTASEETDGFKLSNNLRVIKNPLRPIKEQNFYCPHCTHCNNIQDEYFEKNLNETKEAFNIIKRASEFLIDNTLNNDLYQDLYSILNIENKTAKEKNTFVIEEFLNEYSRHVNNRSTYLQTIYFLQALIDDKIQIGKFTSFIKNEKLNNTLLYQGQSFEEKKSNLEFEKELEGLFDNNMKEMIKNIFKSKK